MANKQWKKFEQSNGFRKFKLKLRQLIGKEPHLTIDIVLATENYSGWQVVTSLLVENDIVYSMGICDEIGFELAVCQQQKIQLFAFDPTPYSVAWVAEQELPANFQFYPWAVSGTDGEFFIYPRINSKGKASSIMYSFHHQDEGREDGVKVKALTIDSIAAELGHDTINILKMDIEGAEYAVLDSLLNSKFRPRMLLVEFHHRFKGIGKDKTIDIVTKLRKAGYLVTTVSNTGREVCLVHKTAVQIATVQI